CWPGKLQKPDFSYWGLIHRGAPGNLVHHDVLTPSTKSPVFVASRAGKEEDQEFLASTDSWFRPTNFTVGPDVYLYVLDYYRQHIETPVSIPDELKADMDFMAGSDKGRIYRILPINASPKNSTVNLAKASNTKLLETLSHPNLWWRLQAQRLLLEKQDKSVVPAVKSLFRKIKDARTRLHALYVLEGLNALDAEIIKKALQDTAPGVRENAIILAEQFPEAYPQVLEKINDPEIRVAFQATLSLPEFKDKETAPTLVKVLEKYGQDFWFRLAVLSSEQGSTPEMFKLLSQQKTFFQKPEPWKTAYVGDLSNIIGARNQKDQISVFLNLLSQQESQIADSFQVEAIKGLTKGLTKASSADPKLKETLQGIKTGSVPEITAAIQDLKKLY
ncbi:MAG: dehydrogenase, partial [Bacteroidota bacterium]|nr:dehydrogenase [Bacteroidota bacterium]